MHLSSLLLLGLSAGALSLPTSNSTGSSLDKRFSYGWIGSFTDPSCTTVDYSDFQTRPELHRGVCTLFNVGEDNFVGIDWGAGKHYGFSVLQAYNDTGCEYPIAEIKNSDGKAGDCVNLLALGGNGKGSEDFDFFGDWNSVKAIS